MYSVDEKHRGGIIYVYVGCCNWEKNFDYCLKEFILTIFHEAMHIMLPEIEDYIPYAEKILADVLEKEPNETKDSENIDEKSGPEGI